MKLLDWLKNLFSKSFTPPKSCFDEKDDRNFGSEVYGGDVSREDIPTEDFIVYDPILQDQLDTDNCFPAGTPVLMDDFTYTPIEKVKKGEVVYSHLGLKRKVTGITQRKWQGTMVKIKVFGDDKVIKSTPEHPFLVVKNTKKDKEKNSDFVKRITPEFLPAKQIKKGDYLMMPKINFFKDLTIYDYEKDPEFLWVIGLYLAEGNVNCSYRVAFSLNDKEEEYAIRIKKCLERYGAKVDYYIMEKYHRITVYVYDNKWVNIFEELCGNYCDKKRIDKRLMLIDPILQMNIVEGFIDGDGSRKKNIVMVSTSYELLNQIRTILLRNGQMTSFYQRSSQENRLPSWNLEINGKERVNYLVDDNNFYVMVKSIEHNQKEYYTGCHVYNLHIEEDESYLVNGIAVHNCVGFSSAYTREATEGIQLSGPFAFAMAKKADGTINGWGTSPLKVAKQLVNVGICERNYWPVKSNARDYLANWNNIPADAYTNASVHKAGSYFEVNTPWGWDRFDTILAYLNKFKNQKLLIMTGADGHAITPIGMKNGKLMSKDSYDRARMNYNIGVYDKGYRYFTRAEVNSGFFTPYMVTDMPRALAELLNRFNGKLIKSDGDDIFLVKEGKKWLFESEEALWSHGYWLTQSIGYLTDDELGLIPNGQVLTVENGQNKELINEVVNLVAHNPDRFIKK